MFDGYRELWTPVAFSSELGRKPLGVEIASTRVVLWRGPGGVSALLDKCPHRGVKLSLGQVRDGCLECPFHGWRFAADGACAHVPMQPRAKRELLGVGALPVREVGGLLWVFTGPEAVGEPAVPSGLLRSDVARFEIAETWQCHWTRAMENMLDYPHLPFVHATTIGVGIRRRMTAASELSFELEDTPTGFTIHTTLDGDTQGKLSWLRPNGMELEILPDDRGGMRGHAFCVPVAPDRTRMMIVATRGFGLYNPLYKLTDWFNAWVLRQDRRVCESHDPLEVPAPEEERSVAADKPTLAFRRWYLRQGAGETAGADGVNRPTSISAS
ncbi:MAG: aromatic ring-hydroxylating dioxygenase subunit alpha [Myxococcota bacterium]